ncbi:MAG: response regulator [Cyanobacteria bacterium KgW148]|nr:response regulator [Cyanobacteria bacterium KgW148]
MNALFKKLLSPRQLEYLSINGNFTVTDFSTGVQRFAEANTRIALNIDARSFLPELVGLESVIHSLLLQDFPYFDIKAIARQNIYFDLMLFSDPEDETIVILFEDVTERMQLEQKLLQRTNETLLLMEALSESKRYLEQIIDRVADIILVTTEGGTIKLANQAAKRILGADIFGKNIQNITNHQVTLSPEGSEVTLENEGREITIGFSCGLIPINQNHHELVFCGKDITASKQLSETLKQAEQEAIAHSQAKSLFLANMTHEIRTPMNSVLGMAELLLDTNPTPEQEELIEAIQVGGETLLSLINDILDISKLEAGKTSLEFLPFEVRPTIEEIVAILAPQAHRKGLEINNWIDHRLGMKLAGDRQRLKQVVINLLSNAIKFTSTGEVTIRVELRSQINSIAKIYVTVSDTGVGIPIEFQDKLFHSFSQADNTHGGTGLGLAICKQLVNLMGGEIGLLQSSPQGTTFWFEIPFSVLEPAPAIKPLNYHLVLISSCKNTIESAQELGLSLGVNIIGISSVEKLNSDRVQGILIDSSLGEISVSNIKEVNQSPLILLVPAHRIDWGKKSLDCGFDYFLTKPLRSARLSQILDRIDYKSLPLSAEPKTIINRSLKILLAEDNPTNQLVAKKLLQKLGYSADIVGNGAEAVEKFSDYDVILMDCQMPVLDGYEATKAIRAQQPKDRKIIIIAMTANAFESDRERCLAAGMDEYLSKPISAERLGAILKWATEQID